jgi:hypothetical protein
MRRRLLFYTAAMLFAVGWSTFAFGAGDDASSKQAVITEGSVKLTVRVDRNVARVVEPIQFTLEVEAPRGTRVELPNLTKQLGDFDVRRSERLKDVPVAASADVRSWILKAKLETIKTGDLTIPPLDVRYSTDTKSETFNTLTSKPLAIQITSVLENGSDPRKFHDIKDVVDVAVPEQPSRAWIVWTAAGTGAVLAGLALVVVVAKWRRRGPSPAEWALAAIADLQKATIANAADAEAVFNEVVDIVREFFELEFGVQTLSRTTREFLADAMEQVELGNMPRKRLMWLAKLADEIKFARRGIGGEQVRQAFEQAGTFVEECEQHRQTLDKEAA